MAKSLLPVIGLAALVVLVVRRSGGLQLELPEPGRTSEDYQLPLYPPDMGAAAPPAPAPTPAPVPTPPAATPTYHVVRDPDGEIYLQVGDLWPGAIVLWSGRAEEASAAFYRFAGG